jgi:hypothetical protein
MLKKVSLMDKNGDGVLDANEILSGDGGKRHQP